MSEDCPKAQEPIPAEMWEERYRTGETGWDLGGPPPALVSLIGEIEARGLRVFVPGCGNGHDAIAWARADHDVVAVDYAERAVAGATQNAAAAGVSLDVLQADIFQLPSELDGGFDVIWEQTCYCAIHPSLRDSYVEVCARLLKPDGLYYGLLWNHGNEGGPPFDVTPEDIRTRFGAAFVIRSLEPSEQSVETRENEFLARLTRRG